MAKIKNNDMGIFICDECDTVWKSTNIAEDNSFRFEDIMKHYGLPALWSELIDVEKYQENPE